LTVQFTSLVAFAKKNPYFVSHGNFCRSSLTRFTSVCSDFYFKLTQIFVYRSNDYTTDLRLVTSFRCHVWGCGSSCGISPRWPSLQRPSWLPFREWSLCASYWPKSRSCL